MLLLLTLISLLTGPAHAQSPQEIRQAIAAYEDASLCGGEGARCVTNLDCCRGSCVRMICRRGPIFDPCKPNGSACRSGSECCSKMCLGSRCQPRIEP